MPKTKDDATSLFEQGNKCSSEKKWEQAVALFHEFLKSHADHEWALNNCGFCLAKIGRWAEAESLLVRALRVNPENTRALSNMVMVCEGSGDKLSAIPYRRALAQAEPMAFDNLFHLANSLMAAGNADEALHYYRRAIRLNPRHLVCRSNYLLGTNYSESLTVEEVASEHFRHGQAWLRQQLPPYSRVSELPPGPLRIGYLSPDFGHHPVGKIMLAVFQAHDRSKFRITCYSDRGEDDPWTEKIRDTVDDFHDTGSMTDQQLLDLMREDNLAVAIELSGHTGGRNRLAVLAARVAPLQVSFLGYPNTTGVDGIDCFVTDRFCDPPGKTDSLHMEPLLRLKSGFLCFDPWISELPNMEAPRTESDYVTFASFNNPSKVSSKTFDLWAEIMRRAPQVRLLIKYGGKFKSEWLRDQWRSAFAERGVATSRVKFFNADPTLSGHYARMASVDLSLDPFPYQGTTTTLESLSVGTPVLTRAGESYCRRASSALLLRLSLDELVTTSDDEYVNRAVELAEQPERLFELRQHIQKEFPNSSIRDCEGFVREFEQTLESQLAFRGLKSNQDTAADQQSIRHARPTELEATDRHIVTCTGLPRSGSTWAYNVVRLLLNHCYGADNVHSTYQEGPAGDNAIQAALEDPHHTLLKLHYPEEGVMNAVCDGIVRNIYTIRHPLAALASFREKFGGRVPDIANRLKKSLEAADAWKELGNHTLFITFEDLVASPDEQLRRITSFLDLKVDQALAADILEETSFESVQRITKRLESEKSSGKLQRAGDSFFDPETQYHLNHAIRSTTRDWRAELSFDDKEIASEILAKWLPAN